MKGGLRTPVIVAVILAAVYFSRSVLVPFLLGAVIAYVLSPLVSALERRGVNRAYGAIVVMVSLVLVLAGVVAIAVPEVVHQTTQFSDRLPGYREALQQRLDSIEAYFDARSPGRVQALSDQALSYLRGILPSIAAWAARGAKEVMTSFGRFVVWLLTIVVIPVFTYYLLADSREIWTTVRGTLPVQLRPRIEARARECDRVLRAWLKGQLTVALVLAVIYSIGLTILGVPLGLLIGVVGGLANLVPYLGLAVGFLPAAALSFLDSGSWIQPLLVAGVFALGQILEGTVITPRVIGTGLGLPPAVVLLSVMVGGALFGFTGLLLAVPVTAAGLVVIKDMNKPEHRRREEAGVGGARRPVRRRRPGV